MRIVALLTIRNEALYIERCLRHLIDQGIEVCVIDNESTDESLDLVNRYYGRGVFRIETLPFKGTFDETAKMTQKRALAHEIDAEWFIHQDADEIREAPPGYGTLAEAIAAVDAEGFNAINFNEFVFVPTSEDESFEGRDYVREMRYYYYFAPSPLHRVNAWKKRPLDDTFISSGGHRVHFPDIAIYPHNFVLRHYIGLSKRHMMAKYGGRVHAMAEVTERRINYARAYFSPRRLRLPERSSLKRLTDDGHFDTADPFTRHPFLMPPAQEDVPQAPTAEGVDGQPAFFVLGPPHAGSRLLKELLTTLPSVAVRDARDPGNQGAAGSLSGIHAEGWDLDLRQLVADHPEAVFIHVVRDGRQILAEQHRHGEPMDARDGAIEWLWHVREARQMAQLAERALIVRYEDLIAAPQETMHRVLTTLGLDVDEETLTALTAAAKAATPGEALAVDKGVQTETRALPEEQRADYEAVAGNMLRDMGYPTAPQGG